MCVFRFLIKSCSIAHYSHSLVIISIDESALKIETAKTWNYRNAEPYSSVLLVILGPKSLHFLGGVVEVGCSVMLELCRGINCKDWWNRKCGLHICSYDSDWKMRLGDALNYHERWFIHDGFCGLGESQGSSNPRILFEANATMEEL